MWYHYQSTTARVKVNGAAKEFDEHTVLNAAMNRFWEHGYQATSMRDLAARDRLDEPEPLQCVWRQTRAFPASPGTICATLCARPDRSPRGRACRPKDAIKAFITEIVEHSLNDKDRRGCLLVNSALEIAPHDPEIGAEVATPPWRGRGFFPPIRGRRTEAGERPRRSRRQGSCACFVGRSAGHSRCCARKAATKAS